MRHTVLVVVLAIACAAHCGRATDTLPAPPVATLDVSLSRSTVAAGHLIDVTYRFTVAADAPQLDDDYAVFVHAVEESGKSIWADDHAPAVPARQWKPGDRIEYTRPMFVSRRAYPGPHGLDIGLYSPRTGRRVPLNTPGGRGDSSRLARFEVTSPGPTPVVLFVKGWHLPERESEPGMVPSAEWHWSTRESLLWCANPRRDARFVLHLDQPLQGDEAARQVQVIIGGSLVDSFALAPGAREVRRVPVAGALLGTDDIVPITLRLDRASVPAPAAGAALADGRELGVRVFDALLEPQ